MPRLANPYWLLTALVVLPLLWIYWRRIRQKYPTATFTALNVVKKIPHSSIKPSLRHVVFGLKILALLALAYVMARPQSIHRGQDVHSEGIDIMLIMDISASMLAQDFQPNRVEAAKAVAKEFIQSRPDDRIGITLFAKYAFTQCPLTIDHWTLVELIDAAEIGLSDPDNTAIGSALGSGLNRLKSSDSKSKVIILLTDGENNFGLPPLTAVEAAEALGVRVYTIGVGRRGTAPYPATDIFGRQVTQQVKVSIDEDLLTQIAEKTGGQYFRATDNNKLKSIFEEIDHMEKTRIEVRAYKRFEELYYPWALVALGILVLGLIVGTLLLRGIA